MFLLLPGPVTQGRADGPSANDGASWFRDEQQGTCQNDEFQQH
jgi:hypothetical protein